MCTDASPSKNTHLGLLCALWHLWFDLVKRANPELGEELLMVTELGDGRERTPARSIAALSAPSQSLGPDLVSFATSCERRVWRTVDSRCSVDAYWTEDMLCASLTRCPDPAPGAPHLDSICLCIRRGTGSGRC